MFRKVDFIFRQIALGFLFIYQAFSLSFHHLSYILGYPSFCRYPESCSHFAMRQINENKSIISAIYNIFRRLLSCGPWAIIPEIFRAKSLSSREGVLIRKTGSAPLGRGQ